MEPLGVIVAEIAKEMGRSAKDIEPVLQKVATLCIVVVGT